MHPVCEPDCELYMVNKQAFMAWFNENLYQEDNVYV